MNRPRVSVLMPVYNAENTLSVALKSVLRQTYSDYGIVVVDDGSTDRTPLVLGECAARNPQVKVVRSEHQGIIAALNTGIEVCTGDFIARMDADDVSHRRRLELQVNFLTKRPDVSVCSSLVRIFPRPGLQGGLLHYERWLNSLLVHEQIVRDVFVESPVVHPSAMLRRSEVVAMGGYLEHGWAEDYDLWLRYHESGKTFAKVAETLLWWRHREGRLTFSDSRYSVENFLRAKAHYIATRLSGYSRPIVVWGAGRIGKRLIRHLLREGIALQAIVDVDTRKIGQSVCGLPVAAKDHLSRIKGAFVIAAVGSAGARRQIREHLHSIGYVELRDFLCAA